MAAASVSWHPGIIFSRSPAGGAFLCALNILLDVYADFFFFCKRLKEQLGFIFADWEVWKLREKKVLVYFHIDQSAFLRCGYLDTHEKLFSGLMLFSCVSSER